MTADLRRLAEQATPGPWGNEPPSKERATVNHIIRENITGPQVANVLIAEDAAYIAAANPQAILTLLDERDHHFKVINGTTDAWQRAERRVAALEEGLRLIQGDGCLASIWASDDPLVWERCLDPDYREEPLTGNPDADRCEACEARALLAAAPSEPPDNPVLGFNAPTALSARASDE